MNNKIQTLPVCKSVPFDNTSQSFLSTEAQSALVELRNNIVWNPEYNTTSVSGTLTLVQSNTSMQFFTGTATGYSVKLPNATTLFNGFRYNLFNQSSQSISIKDDGSNVLGMIDPGSIGYVFLQSNSTANGIWVLAQSGSASAVLSYSIESSTSFSTTSITDVLITGFTITPQFGTYAVWYGGQASSNKNNARYDCTVYKGGVTVPASKRSFLGTSATYITTTSTMTIVAFTGGEACDVRVAAPDGGTLIIDQRSLILIRLGI